MGGSSSGGESGANTYEREQKQSLAQQQGMLGKQAAQYDQMGNLINQSGLAGQGLTQAEQQQLQAIDVGQQRAEQGIQQNVREQASARGLYSSAGAIGQEAAGLANLDIQRSQNIADIYGNAQQRQFQGLGLLGNVAGGYGQVAGGYGQVAGGYGNIGSQNAQMEQTNYNRSMQQQQQRNQSIMGAGKLIAAPFTGGMSLAGGF